MPNRPAFRLLPRVVRRWVSEGWVSAGWVSRGWVSQGWVSQGWVSRARAGMGATRSRASWAAGVLLTAACGAPGGAEAEAETPTPDPSASSVGSADAPGASQVVEVGPERPDELPPDRAKPRVGALGFATTVYAKPSRRSAKLGYLRVGAQVEREAEPAGTRGCRGGWYRIEPRGYVCVGEEATLDVPEGETETGGHPLLRAAAQRPNRDKPLPYRYGFVRSVLPFYLRVPTAKQQFKSEFKLEEHLEWFKEHRDEVQRAGLGALDLAVDIEGRVIANKRLGELGREHNTAELSVGPLFGAEDDDDPPPFWLRDGERLIPNISAFRVPDYAVFADRARRHTGLAFVGSFQAGEHSLKRRFGITTDLRLAPTTKVKPDSASPWHGVELEGSGWNLPLAMVRKRGVQAHRIDDGIATPVAPLARRSVLALSGKVKKVEGERYLQLDDGRYVFHEDVGVAVRPRKFPALSAAGERWVEIDLSEQVLTLWEGTKPVFTTLVSTGRPAIGDPDATTATPRGIFRVYAKHISATMDSDEGVSRRKQRKDGLKPGDEGYIPGKGDGVYGVTLRRGHGLFQLRDVPYIQYFEKQYAIHGAYWHDVFGIARSHGCINLAPTDALRVFKFTANPVPRGWHGVNLTEGRGTAIVIHK